MITTKERFCVKLRPETIEKIKCYSREAGMCFSKFVDFLSCCKTGKCKDVSYDRHPRKGFCVRIERSSIEALRMECQRRDVSLESLLEARLYRYETKNLEP